MLLGVAIVAASASGAYVLFFGGWSQPRGTLALSPQDAAIALKSSSTVRDSGSEPKPGKPMEEPDARPRGAGTRDDRAPDRNVVGGKPSEVAGVASDGLTIISKPAGARVYIDGAEQGQTPLKMPGPADHHTAVLFLAGHDLATLEIDKVGTFHADLKEIIPIGGPAGIKVRCRVKDRYYVYIDGKPTGALCPTERLEVDRGEHVVEIYDLVSETRRQFRIVVKNISRSTRVRVD
jgi:hypothetical protein